MVLPFKGYAQQPVDGTLGFVVRDWFTAIYNSRFVDECPEGLAVSNDENWWWGLSKEKRVGLTVNGLRPKLDRYPTAMRRGPNGENVCLNLTVVTDPPIRLWKASIPMVSISTVTAMAAPRRRLAPMKTSPIRTARPESTIKCIASLGVCTAGAKAVYRN